VAGPIDGAGALYKAGAGTLVANYVSVGTLSIEAGTISIAQDGTSTGLSTIGTLAFATGTTLDLVNNDLIVRNSSYSTIASKIASARNGGAWNGSGLTSSAAPGVATLTTTLGTMTGSEYRSVYGLIATFDGAAVAAGDVLVKYTYYGDTDLNGVVNYDDYARTDTGFNNGRSGWMNGDFDYNGVVNFDDYSLIDNAFLNQGGLLTGGPDGNPLLIELGQMPHFMWNDYLEHFIDWEFDHTGIVLTPEDFYPHGRPGTVPPPGPVPEPTTLFVTAFVAAGAMMRRHRRSHA
jgi:hypothetical protein